MMALLSVYFPVYIQCLFLPFLCTLLLCGSLHCRSTLIPFARFAGFTAVVPLFSIYIASPSFIFFRLTYLLPDLFLILSSSLLVSLLIVHFSFSPSFHLFYLFPTICCTTGEYLFGRIFPFDLYIFFFGLVILTGSDQW